MQFLYLFICYLTTLITFFKYVKRGKSINLQGFPKINKILTHQYIYIYIGTNFRALQYSYCKIWSLMRENFDYGKRESFCHLIKITLETSLYLPEQVCLTYR
jgi:hypothetical protein